MTASVWTMILYFDVCLLLLLSSNPLPSIPTLKQSLSAKEHTDDWIFYF